jgi:hypothetical protein
MKQKLSHLQMALPLAPNFSSSSPTLTDGQHDDRAPLPQQVEGLIVKICREQGIDPPDNRARFKLHQLGEDASMDILRKIERSTVRKSFSALLMYLAKSHESPGACNTPPVRGESC